jgi:hypothetical protein
MARYRFKNGTVDGRQFVGGPENGKELVDWINAGGQPAEYWERQEIEDQDIVLPEKLIINNIATGDVVERTDWVVKLGPFFLIYTDEAFKKDFDKA